MKENTQSKPPFPLFKTIGTSALNQIWSFLLCCVAPSDKLCPASSQAYWPFLCLLWCEEITFDFMIRMSAEPSVCKESGQLCFIAGYLLSWPNQITSLIAQFLYLQHRNGHVFLNPSQWPVNEKHSIWTIIIIISEVMLGVMTLAVCKVTGEKQKSSLNKGCVQATVVQALGPIFDRLQWDLACFFTGNKMFIQVWWKWQRFPHIHGESSSISLKGKKRANYKFPWSWQIMRRFSFCNIKVGSSSLMSSHAV